MPPDLSIGRTDPAPRFHSRRFSFSDQATPHPSPLPQEREPVIGCATTLPLAILHACGRAGRSRQDAAPFRGTGLGSEIQNAGPVQRAKPQRAGPAGVGGWNSRFFGYR